MGRHDGKSKPPHSGFTPPKGIPSQTPGKHRKDDGKPANQADTAPKGNKQDDGKPASEGSTDKPKPNP